LSSPEDAGKRVEVYWFTDIGRPRNSMFVVESGRLVTGLDPVLSR
jgi:hypothetical protein